MYQAIPFSSNEAMDLKESLRVSKSTMPSLQLRREWQVAVYARVANLCKERGDMALVDRILYSQQAGTCRCAAMNRFSDPLIQTAMALWQWVAWGKESVSYIKKLSYASNSWFGACSGHKIWASPTVKPWSPYVHHIPGTTIIVRISYLLPYLVYYFSLVV